MDVAIVLLLLLAINGLFVAAEFASIGTKESRVRRAAESGSRAAKALLPIVQDPMRLDRYISTCQLGITTTSLGLGAYCERVLAVDLAAWFESWGEMQTLAAHSLAVVIVLVCLTVVQVVLAEQAPKSIALHVPDRVALMTVFPVFVFQWSLKYAIAGLNRSARLFLRLLRAPAEFRRHVHSRQEIDLMMELSHEEGAIEAEQHERLQQVLELEVVTARGLMVPRRDIAALDIEATGEDPLQAIIEGRHTRMPVYRNTIDDVVGVIHTKDLARHAVEKGSVKEWRKLIRPISFVNEGMTADRLLAVLREKKTQQAMVMDEFGGVEGLVTLEDVLTHVLGEVEDESSVGVENPQRLPDGVVRLPGRLRLDEAADWTKILWKGTSTTVGGLITERLGHLPVVGETAEIDGVHVEVESVENHVVTSVLARPATGGELEGTDE